MKKPFSLGIICRRLENVRAFDWEDELQSPPFEIFPRHASYAEALSEQHLRSARKGTCSGATSLSLQIALLLYRVRQLLRKLNRMRDVAEFMLMLGIEATVQGGYVVSVTEFLCTWRRAMQNVKADSFL